MPENSLRPQIQRCANQSVALMTLCVNKKKNNLNISEFYKNKVLPQLRECKDIGEIRVEGNREEIIEIKPNWEKMRLFEISNENLYNSILMADNPLPVANLKQKGIETPIIIENRIKNLDEIKKIKIEPSNIELSKIAQIKIDKEKSDNFFMLNGIETVAIFIYGSGSNPVKTTKNVIKKIAKINKNQSGQFELEVIENNTLILTKSLRNALFSFIFGITAAFIILFLFSKSLVTSLLATAMIPVSFSITIFVLGCMNMSLNLISLSGLAVASGMIIDNNILVLERFCSGGDKKSVYLTVISSTLTTIIIFLPLFFIKGITGLLFKDLAISVTLTLVGSLLTSLFLLPALYNLNYIKKKTVIKSETLFIKKHYGDFIRKIIINRKKQRILFSLPFLFMLLSIVFIRGEFLPIEKKGNKAVEFLFDENYSIEELKSESSKIQATFFAKKNSLAFSQGGNSLTRKKFVPHLNSKSIIFTITNCSNRELKRIKKSLLNSNYKNNYYTSYTASSIIDGVIGNYPFRNEGALIFDDKKQLQESREKYREMINVILRKQKIRYKLELNNKFLLQNNLNAAKVSQAIYSLLNKQTIKKMNFDSGIIKLQTESRKNINKDVFLNSMIKIDKNGYKIAKLAKLIKENQELTLLRINGKPSLLLKQESNKLSKKVQKFYPSELAKQSGGILITGLFSIIFLFCILGILLNNWKIALIIMATLPPSILGALFTLVISSNTLNLNSIIALLVLCGTAVNSTIIIYQSTQNRKLNNKEIVNHAVKRVRPILMTVLTTIAALIPFLTYNSMAITLIGGLITSTYVSLIIIPLFHNHKREIENGT